MNETGGRSSLPVMRRALVGATIACGLLLGASCVRHPDSATAPQTASVDSPPPASAATRAPTPTPPKTSGVDLSSLPLVKVADVPERSRWVSRVRSRAIEGWHPASRSAHLPRGAHTRPHGLFASRAAARTFTRRGELAQAGSGTCFRVAWPTRKPQTAAELVDLEAVVYGDPHVAHRGGWTGAVAWVQGTKVQSVSEDGQTLAVTLTEAWMATRHAHVQSIDTQTITLHRIPGGPEGFARFGARQDEGVHLMVIPVQPDGRLQLGPPDDPSADEDDRFWLTRIAPCPWTRAWVGPTPVRLGISRLRRLEPQLTVTWVVEQDDGRMWLRDAA